MNFYYCEKFLRFVAYIHCKYTLHPDCQNCDEYKKGQPAAQGNRIKCNCKKKGE